MSSFKSSENIQKKEVGSDRTVSDNHAFLKSRDIFVFSRSNRFVALNLITDPLTFICLNTFSSDLSFSNSPILSWVRFSPF